MATSSLPQLSANENGKGSETKTTNYAFSPMATGPTQLACRLRPSFVDMAYRQTIAMYSTDESSSSQMESDSESDTDLVRNFVTEMSDEAEDEWEEEEEEMEEEVEEEVDKGGEETEVCEKEGIAPAVWTPARPDLNQLRSPVQARTSGRMLPKEGDPVGIKDFTYTTTIYPLQHRPEAGPSLLSPSSRAPLTTTSAFSISAPVPVAALISNKQGPPPFEVTETKLPLNGAGIYPILSPGSTQNATGNSKQLSTSNLASTSTPTSTPIVTRASTIRTTTSTATSINNVFIFTGHPNTPLPDPASSPIVGPSSQDKNVHIGEYSEFKPHRPLLDIDSTLDDEGVAAHLCSRFPVFEAVHDWMQLSLLHPCPRMECCSDHMVTSAQQERVFIFNRAVPKLVFERPWRRGRHRGSGSD